MFLCNLCTRPNPPVFRRTGSWIYPNCFVKKRGPPLSFLHCDMFTFVFRHSFFICVFGKDGTEWDEILILLQEVRERFFFERRKNDLSRPFFVREISNPNFWCEEKLPISLEQIRVHSLQSNDAPFIWIKGKILSWTKLGSFRKFFPWRECWLLHSSNSEWRNPEPKRSVFGWTF